MSIKPLERIAFFIILLTNQLFANSTIDSLESRLEIVDTKEKSELLNQLSEAYLKVSPEKALVYAIEAEAISHKLHDETNNGKAIKIKAHAYLALNRYTEALSESNHALVHYTRLNQTKELAEINNLQGIINKEINEYSIAIIKYNKAIDLYKQISDSLGLAQSYNLIGSLYYKQSDYRNSLLFYQKALDIRTRNTDKEATISSYYNIALVQREQGKFQDAISTLNKAIGNFTNNKNTEQQSNIYHLMGSIYLKMREFEKALKMYQKALNIRIEADLKQDIATSYINIGQLYKEMNLENQALQNFQKALDLYKILNNKKGIASTLNNMGGMYLKTKKYSQALQLFLESLYKSMEIDDKSQSLNAIVNIGNIYYEIGNSEKAHDYFKNALSLSSELKDNIKLASVHNQIGNLFLNMQKHEDAISHFEKSLQLREQIGEQMAVASSLNNIGGVYSDLKQFKKALYYYSRALAIRQQINDKAGISTSLNNIGNIYYIEEKYDQALNYFTKALSVAVDIKFDFNIGLCSRKIGEIFFKTKQHDKAFPYFNKSIEYGKKLNNFELLRKGYSELYNFYLIKNDYKKSLEYYQLFTAYEDSISNTLNNKRITELQIGFDLKQREAEIKQIEIEIAELKNEKKLRDLELSRQKSIRNLLIIISILILALGILFYNRFKNKKRSEQLLQEKVETIEKTNAELTASKTELTTLNSTKDKFFSIIAHDIKNPLGGIMNLSEMLASDYRNIPDEELQELFVQLNNSSNQLYELLENLLHWSRVQLGRIPFNPQNIVLKDIVDNNFKLLQINSDKKEISMLNKISEQSIVYGDKDMLTLIIRNLLANAIKYTPLQGQISASSIGIGNTEEISIKDTGIGMTAEEISKIFRIDSQFSKKGTNNESGTGLGLILCQEFVRKNGGNISVESNAGMGSRFIFTIPKGQIL